MAVYVGRRRNARVTEDPRHNRQLFALFRPERRTGMAKVVEALAREAGRGQRSVDGGSGRPRRGTTRSGSQTHSAVMPPGSGHQPFLQAGDDDARGRARSGPPRATTCAATDPSWLGLARRSSSCGYGERSECRRQAMRSTKPRASEASTLVDAAHRRQSHSATAAVVASTADRRSFACGSPDVKGTRMVMSLRA